MQGPARLAGGALAVELGGDPEGVGIGFDDGIDARAGAVDGLDALQVARHQGVRGERARTHGPLLLPHPGIEEAAGAGRRRCRRRARHTGDGAGHHTQSNEVPAVHAPSLLCY